MVFKEMGMNGEERTIVAGSPGTRKEAVGRLERPRARRRGSGGRRRGSRRLSFGGSGAKRWRR